MRTFGHNGLQRYREVARPEGRAGKPLATSSQRGVSTGRLKLWIGRRRNLARPGRSGDKRHLTDTLRYDHGRPHLKGGCGQVWLRRFVVFLGSPTEQLSLRLLARAGEIAAKRLAEYVAPPIDDAVRAELEEYVVRRRRELGD